jgi:hypothetical protein
MKVTKYLGFSCFQEESNWKAVFSVPLSKMSTNAFVDMVPKIETIEIVSI